MSDDRPEPLFLLIWCKTGDTVIPLYKGTRHALITSSFIHVEPSWNQAALNSHRERCNSPLQRSCQSSGLELTPSASSEQENSNRHVYFCKTWLNNKSRLLVSELTHIDRPYLQAWPLVDISKSVLTVITHPSAELKIHKVKGKRMRRQECICQKMYP